MGSGVSGEGNKEGVERLGLLTLCVQGCIVTQFRRVLLHTNVGRVA